MGSGWDMVGRMAIEATCDWPVDMSCFPGDIDLQEHGDKVRAAIDTATHTLWAFTGRQFGQCEVEYVPDVSLCRPCAPTLFRGEWYNIDPGSPSGCMAVHLPGPVAEIVSVVDDRGEDIPAKQTEWGMEVMGTPAVVRYVRGLPVPPGGALAVGRLASQVYLQCVGDKRCRLPQNVTQVQRQGVTASFEPPEPGKTGLADVDMWVQSVNPNGLQEQTEVVI